MTLQETFRANLLAAIRRDGRPIKDIARVSGYSESHVRRMIKGHKPNPSLLVVQCLAEALGVEPSDMLKARP